jgi:hypothetical protein
MRPQTALPEKNPTFSRRATVGKQEALQLHCVCGPRTEQGLAGVPAHLRMQQAGVELCETAARAD